MNDGDRKRENPGLAWFRRGGGETVACPSGFRAWNRREVLAGVAGLLALKLPAGAAPADVGVAFKGTVEEKVAKAVLLATGKDPAAFFKTVVTPKDTVGLKLNCLAGRPLAPRVEVVEALVRYLAQAGVPEEQILVWDRSDRELQRAGFDIRTDGKGYRCTGTNGLYDKEVSESRSVGSCFASILSQKITKLINVGVMKDHDLAGVSVGLKNYYGVIHNPNKYHDSNCDPYLADLFEIDLIRKKHRLTILDALRVQYHRGPSYHPQWNEKTNQLIFGFDPVAVDAVGWKLIENLRAKKGLPTLSEERREPTYLQTAENLGLGLAHFDNIEIIEEEV